MILLYMFEYRISVISTMFHTASNHTKCSIKSNCCFKSTNNDIMENAAWSGSRGADYLFIYIICLRLLLPAIT